MKIIVQSDQEPEWGARAARTALRNHPDAKPGHLALITYGDGTEFAVSWNKSSVTVWKQDSKPPITQ